MQQRPERHEAAAYYFKYIDRVPDGDIRATLETQLEETLAFLKSIPEGRERHRYAADKWTIAEVVSHINDIERVFAFRAFWFARGQEPPLPSMEQEIVVARAGAHERPWTTHIAEFAALRAASVELFRHLPGEAWAREGIASDNRFTVRAIAWILAGHVLHHATILRERYLVE